MPKIQSTIAATQAVKNIHKAQSNLAGSVRKISTGYRINSASDDAAGLGMGSFMQAEAKSILQAMKNSNDGVSLLQTAEGAITEQTNMLVRMRELLVQAGNDVYGSDERNNILTELKELRTEYSRIASIVNFNGKHLLNSTDSLAIQVGKDGNVDNKISIDLSKFNTTATASGVSSLETVFSQIDDETIVSTSDLALSGMESVDTAIVSMTSIRGDIGALQNRFSSTLAEASTQYESTVASQGRILDADYATESANMTKHQIMLQSSVASLAQAKNIPQSLLALIA